MNFTNFIVDKRIDCMIMKIDLFCNKSIIRKNKNDSIIVNTKTILQNLIFFDFSLSSKFNNFSIFTWIVTWKKKIEIISSSKSKSVSFSFSFSFSSRKSKSISLLSRSRSRSFRSNLRFRIWLTFLTISTTKRIRSIEILNLFETRESEKKSKSATKSSTRVKKNMIN